MSCVIDFLFLDWIVAPSCAIFYIFHSDHEIMAGLRIPNTPIVVDYWTIKELPANSLFFLTHAHAGEPLYEALYVVIRHCRSLEWTDVILVSSNSLYPINR